MSKLKSNLLATCDFALTSKEGKLSLIGIFDRIFVNQLPSKYSRFFIVVILQGEEGGQHQINLKITTPSGKDLLKTNPTDLTFSANGKANLITDIANLALDEVGEYKISLESKDKTIASSSLFVTQTSSSPNQLN